MTRPRGAETLRIISLAGEPAAAEEKMSQMEAALNEHFAGCAVTGSLTEEIIAMASAMMPLPQGYGWHADRIADGSGRAHGSRARFLLYAAALADGTPSGYGFAARVTIGFEGGSREVRGDLWKCRRCAAVIFPGDWDIHDRFHDGLGSTGVNG
jgi:hypothetical protein